VRWQSPDFAPPWRLSEVAEAVRQCVEEGWLTPGRVLDIGCGDGRDAAWLAEHGFEAVGVDHSQAAIAQARQKWSGIETLSFEVVDVCKPGAFFASFDTIVDRGCFQGLSAEQYSAYTKNVIAASRPGTKLLILSHFKGLSGAEARRDQLESLLCPPYRFQSLSPTPMSRADSPVQILGAAFRFVHSDSQSH
jgi:cyclopropane fatty-acyl-phospholipid synthase-like methyltransferase